MAGLFAVGTARLPLPVPAIESLAMPAKLSIAMVAFFLSLPMAWSAENDADVVIPIWPESPPDWKTLDQAEKDTSGPDGQLVGGRSVIRLGFVSTPELHVYRAQPSAASDTVVLINPGGGYSILAWDLEGTEIAKWFQKLGVTAVVVKYRVPTRQLEQAWRPAVQDIQRSIALVRSGGIPGVDPKQVGVLGFSAGGNASARAALASQRYYEPVDVHDKSELQPDFAILVYPAWLVRDGDSNQLIEDLKVTADSPPMFFAHAQDDRVNCMSSVTLFSKLKQARVSASLHVFARGGHGYGARTTDAPTDAWPKLCENWMRSQGWMAQ
ncbi:MAG: alpha/beta hydrolase [Rubripirellula sp.]|nr:alpha/beta hydrolase [Rubripirellula sp.]